jgi:hypothetical protein
MNSSPMLLRTESPSAAVITSMPLKNRPTHPINRIHRPILVFFVGASAYLLLSVEELVELSMTGNFGWLENLQLHAVRHTGEVYLQQQKQMSRYCYKN